MHPKFYLPIFFWDVESSSNYAKKLKLTVIAATTLYKLPQHTRKESGTGKQPINPREPPSTRSLDSGPRYPRPPLRCPNPRVPCPDSPSYWDSHGPTHAVPCLAPTLLTLAFPLKLFPSLPFVIIRCGCNLLIGRPAASELMGVLRQVRDEAALPFAIVPSRSPTHRAAVIKSKDLTVEILR